MRKIGGLLSIALVVALSACAGGSPEEQQSRAEYDAMLRVDQVPGVIVASYENWVQIDPTVPEQEIVDTALAVRDILVELGPDRDAKFVAVYPGDPFVNTEFTTRVLDDRDAFERDARTWASLLDEGYTEVRFNVFDDGGDGVLNVHYDPGYYGTEGRSTPTISDTFDALVGALGAPSEFYAGLQTQAVLGDALVTNRSGAPELPDGWGAVLDGVAALNVGDVQADFEPGSTSVRMTGSTVLTAEQSSQIMQLLTDNGVLQMGVLVTYKQAGDSPSVVIYGVDE